MAEQQARSIAYWFRSKYNLAPTDPRYLAMDEQEMELELETDAASHGEMLKTCSECGISTYRSHCLSCVTDDGTPMALTGDPEMDSLIRSAENGEDIREMLKQYDSIGSPCSEQWEDV